VFPETAQSKLENVFSSNKVYRLEVRAGGSGLDQRWLTILNAAPTAGDAVAATAMSSAAGNVTAGSASGALLQRSTGNIVYLKVTAFGANGVTYRIPPGQTLNVLTGLDPSGSYSLAESVGPGSTTISISSGGQLHASAAGVLSFKS
jgi:hypothetical protein